MSWRGHTTTQDEDRIVRQLDALGEAGNTDETGFSKVMRDAVDLIEKLDNALFAAVTPSYKQSPPKTN